MDGSFFQNNPALKGISPQKLSFLMEFAQKNDHTRRQDLLPLLFATSTAAKEKGISFSDEEQSLIISLIRQQLSDSEQVKLDRMLAILKRAGGN